MKIRTQLPHTIQCFTTVTCSRRHPRSNALDTIFKIAVGHSSVMIVKLIHARQPPRRARCRIPELPNHPRKATSAHGEELHQCARSQIQSLKAASGPKAGPFHHLSQKPGKEGLDTKRRIEHEDKPQAHGFSSGTQDRSQSQPPRRNDRDQRRDSASATSHKGPEKERCLRHGTPVKKKKKRMGDFASHPSPYLSLLGLFLLIPVGPVG